ncbi:uncharacterized protein LOC113381335, partial [Ctenocephalides felis]|uniref:uncharacterized protein LOC113381335 n=1 Tax=Ctenocephalides felis TaxID=7515 RepID=UPI000E6E5B45
MARLRARGNNIDQQIVNLRCRRRNLNREAFQYDCSYDYSLHPSVCIGKMDVVCKYCGALKFSQETPGLCCLNGKVKLPSLTPPPEPLYSLLCGETQESRHFLANTQKYNGCFQMTSFGADIIEERGFNPTFKIQGQIHHRIGSLLPFEDTQNKFLQIYELINNVFPEIVSNSKNNEWLSERAILAAKNKDVDDLNHIIQNKIIGTMLSFKSIDCVTNEDEATNYPIEFLNSLDVPGLPPHNLLLK